MTPRAESQQPHAPSRARPSGSCARLERARRDPVFLSQPHPTVLLDEQFVIRATTPPYLDATGRVEDELITVSLFEAFPESPATAELASVRQLTASFERVMSTGRPHSLAPLRYDIPDTTRDGTYLEKRWVVVNSPVRDGDAVVGVNAQIQDVTVLDEDLVAALRDYRDLLTEGDLRSAAARRRVDVVSSFLAMAESYHDLVKEVADLREALRTRPTIEQAKGIIMADRRCTANGAFDILRRLSMDTNVRVADVAAAIVYQLKVAE